MKKYINTWWYLTDCALNRMEKIVLMPWHIEKGFRNLNTDLYGVSFKYFG